MLGCWRMNGTTWEILCMCITHTCSLCVHVHLSLTRSIHALGIICDFICWLCICGFELVCLFSFIYWFNRELQVSWLVWLPQSTWGKNDGVCLGNNRSLPKGWGKFWPLDSLMVNLGSSLEPWSCPQVVRCGGLHKTLSHKCGHGNSTPISPTPS